jgi:hypothetical protein
MRNWDLRTYIAEPQRGPRKWKSKAAEQAAVYANRRRIQRGRGKRLLAQRGEKIERSFAHQFDTGGMDRLYVRGRENVHKRLLLQAAACNLALLMRSLYGTGKPRAASDRKIKCILAVLQFSARSIDLLRATLAPLHREPSDFNLQVVTAQSCAEYENSGFRHGLLAVLDSLYTSHTGRQFWARAGLRRLLRTRASSSSEPSTGRSCGEVPGAVRVDEFTKACRYPHFDSGERRLSRIADRLWSNSERPSFGSVDLVACLPLRVLLKRGYVHNRRSGATRQLRLAPTS